MKQFLQNKQDEYLSPIESWIQILRNQISETETDNTKVQSNQALINESIDRMGNLRSSWGNKYIIILSVPREMCVLDSNFVLSTTESHTYNLSYKITKDLRSIKFYLIQLLNEQEKINNESLILPIDLSSFLYCILASPLLLPTLLIFAIFSPLDNAYPKKMRSGIPLVLFYLAMLMIAAVIYRLEGFIIVSMVIMGISFISGYTKERKQLKNIQSIIHKLNTQWQE